MDSFVAFFIIAAMIFVVGASWLFSKIVNNSEDDTETDSVEDPSPAVTTASSRSPSADTDSKTDGKDHGDTQPSSDEILPGCFYAVAVIVGIGLGITTIAVIGNGGSAEEIGYMIGYTIGGVLSILATGRLIELVGRISENVRAIRERTDSQK